MSELVEHELNLLHGQSVCVVRPGYGTQSDSWTGYLTVLDKTEYPLRFHVGTGFQFASMFQANDVVRIDPPVDADNNLYVIRLKGPADYNRPYQPTLVPLDKA